jgi:hypothetical protein
MVQQSIEDLVEVLRVGHPEQEATARAAGRLVDLIRNGQAAAVAEAGTAEALVRVLRAGKPEQESVAYAARTLSFLASQGQAAAVAEAGAAEALVGVLRAGKPEQRAVTYAADALCNLASKGQAVAVAETWAAEALVRVLRAGEPEQKSVADAALALAYLASEGQAMAVAEAGAAEALVRVLHAGKPEQRALGYAAFALGNLASKGQAAAVAEAGAAKALVGVLRAGEPNQEAVAEAVYALGKLAFKGQAVAVAEAGAAEALVGVLRAGKPEQEAVAVAACALGELASKGQAVAVAEAGAAEALVGVLRAGNPEHGAVSNAVDALNSLAYYGQAAAVAGAGAAEALVGVLRAGKPEQEAVADAANALGKLAVHEPLRATLRRAGVFEPLAEKLDAGVLAPHARFNGLAAVAMLYGEDAANEAANALLSRHDVAPLAVAALRSALAGTECDELSATTFSYFFTKLGNVLPQIRSMSVHAQTRDRLLEAGAAPLIIQGLNAAQTPADRLHAVRCLLNFAWAGPAAAESLRTSGAVETVTPWAEAADDDDGLLELRDAARGLLRALGVIEETAATDDGATQNEVDDVEASEEVVGDATGYAAVPAKKRYEYGVFLSHKQSDAKDFARSLHTLIEGRGVKCFLDVEFRGELNDLELIVSTSRTLLFVLSDNVFDSEWCMKELVAAVRNGVKVVFVLKEGAKWPDKQGQHVLNFPPPWLISARVPAEAQPAFLSKAISHNSDCYAAFAKDLLQRIDAQQEQIESLRGDVAAAAAAAASPAGSGAALARAHAALKAHLEGFHPGLVVYLGALIELGIETVEDLGEIDEVDVESLDLKKYHRGKFLKACGK